MTERIAIVGAGIAGAFLAFRLAQSGHPVVVVDDLRTGRATGWNPGGINPLHGPGFPGFMAAAYRTAFALHAAQQAQVRAASGIDFGWRVVDRLFLAGDDPEADALRGLADHYQAMAGFDARWMDPADMARWDPRIGEHWAGGLMTSGNVRVDAELYRQALLAAAAGLGAQAVSGRLQAVEASGDSIVAIDWGEGRIPVAALCLATGAWADDAISGWSPGATVAVAPLIGDLLLIQSAAPPPRADVSHGLTAIYQHEPGHYWIGGTQRRDVPLGEIGVGTEQVLLDGAQSLMPGWGAPQVVTRASAARPASADGLPLVGRTPNYKNGWIINGLGGKGILLSAWAADGLHRMIDAGGELPEFAFVSPGRAAS